MKTMEERWEDVEVALQDAHLVAWDTCHKIYVALDAIEANWFRTEYPEVFEGSPEETLATLQRWYEESCPLKFIQGVSHNKENPNDGFINLIPQGAEDEYEYEDEEEYEDEDEDEDY
jgi:hypothetical protein